MRKPRNPNWLLISIICVSLLGWLVNTISPVSVYAVGVFFSFLFVSVAFLLLYALKNVRRAILLSLFFTGFLTLRFLQLRDYYYPLLLAAILLSVEFTFNNNSNQQ